MRDLKEFYYLLLHADETIRSLEASDKRMDYREFARALGVLPAKQEWLPVHQRMVSDILVYLAAFERRYSARQKLDLKRVVPPSQIRLKENQNDNS